MKCCEIHAGKLRHRIQLQHTERVDDGGGGSETELVTYAEPWAWIRPASGKRHVFGDQLQEDITHEIILRYRDDIQGDDAISYDGRQFAIRYSYDIEERKRFLMLDCREGGAIV